MEAVITIDVLRRSGADVTVASVEKEKICVDACWGVKIIADSFIFDASDERFDLIALPVIKNNYNFIVIADFPFNILCARDLTLLWVWVSRVECLGLWLLGILRY